MPHFPVFKTTAPSVPAGSHEMRDYYSNDDPPRSSPYTAPSITPYLGLRSRLSQIWFNRWTILLTIVLARVLIACASANNELSSARIQALSACSTVESMGSAMASMPHYMAQGVNEMTAAGIEKSVNALMQTTTLAVTGTEELVVFMINVLVGTYLCLITLAVSGSLHTVLDVVNEAQQALNTLTGSIGDNIADVISTFLVPYNKAKKSLQDITLGTNTGLNLPDLNLDDDIDKLRNLQLPAGLSEELQKLNSSIPNFEDVKNFTESIIRDPFDQVKLLIDKSLGNYTFNRSAFPVPAKEQMTFCSDDNGINDFFDHLNGTISTGKKIFIAILALAAILVCIPMAYREIRRWRTMKARSHLVGSQEHDPMDIVYIVSRPYTSTAGINMSKSAKSDRRQILIRWVVAYSTSEAALFVLALAIAGLFSCLCHYILLKSIEKEVPALTNQVAGFADLVVNKLDNASLQWSLGANKVISETNASINEEMFGWAQNSTAALNKTLTTFVDLTSKTLNDTFGNTVLYEPIKRVLDCLIMLKVQGIQKGLTWIHDNAHINMPLLPNNTFSLGAAASISGDTPADQSFLASPGDVAADKISNVVARFVDNMEEQIRIETFIALCILGVYLIVVLSAIVRASTLWFGHEKVRGEGGAIPNISDPDVAQPGIAQLSVAQIRAAALDFRSDNQDRYQAPTNVPTQVVSHPKESTHDDHGPAPRYSMAVEEHPPRNANPFADTKRIYNEDDFDTDNKI